MHSNKRALRRFNRENKIKRARKMYSDRASFLEESEEEKQRWALRNYNNMQKCSCSMCGHRRQYNGLTMQERRQLQSFKDD